MQEEKTILIVDDSKSNIDILVSLLGNYDVLVALDGFSAIEIANEEEIDLILLDIVMPEMDGYETCLKLKSNPKIKDIPIIFLTSKSDEVSIERAYDVGGVDYITKPFKPKELISRIKTHLHLQDMLKDLDAMVKLEIKKQMEQEKILIEQSKFAAMGEMVDAIAHQWKQPLGIIRLKSEVLFGNSELRDEPPTEKEMKAYHDFVNRQIDHMIETLDEFRDFLRPDKDKKSFSLLNSINSVLVLIKDELIKYYIETIVDESVDFEIVGIENEFKHILLNLVSNAKDAIKINKISEPKIYFRIREVDNKIIVEIEDNGGGVSEEIIDDIFKPNVSTKSEDGGTGIGLYMSQQIAKKHGGVIKVKNINNGALFQIILPKEKKLS